jgi:hypothetical protein
MEWLDALKFDANGLIPAVIQDADTGQVLMVGYMNRESLQRTVETGLCTYWSRSRQKYWVKGETSGHLQHVQAHLGGLRRRRGADSGRAGRRRVPHGASELLLPRGGGRVAGGNRACAD